MKDSKEGMASRSLFAAGFNCPLKGDKEQDTSDATMEHHGLIKTIQVSKKEC